MVSSRKRGRQEMEAPEPPKEQSMVDRLRNMWEFANLMQWIALFGKAVKIDEDFDIEDLEMECLKPQSTVLADIGLALLKFVSSHRGLTPEIFDEYTRRQYVAKAPHRNPFGTEEEPAKFTDFDVFTKLRVLQQLTQWTMINPDRIRERMEEQKDSDQTFWRVEPCGWDANERMYFVLDDNRLYRRTDPPPPPPPAPKPKKGSKKAKAALRASKRRKVSEPAGSDEEEHQASGDDREAAVVEDDGLGGSKWECLAITLEDLNSFLASLQKTRDPEEKELRAYLTDALLPILEKQEESRKRKQAQKEKELLNLEKLASAKRSSRIAGKQEQQRQEEEAKEAERQRQAELAMAKKEQEKWQKLEKERETRMMTREQRVKEREARRILHEEELAGLSEDSKKLEAGESRLSERHLKAEIERKKQALEELAGEDDWVFDCICGAYGQVDDGSHSISCEKCNIWQHTKCVGIREEDADGDDFHFVCQTCKRRAANEAKEVKRRIEEAKRRAEEEERAKHQPKITLKIKRPGSSSSPAPPTPFSGSILPAASPSLNDASPGLSPQKPSQSRPPSSTSYASPYGGGAILPPQYQQSQQPRFPTLSPSAPKIDGRPVSQGSATSSHWSPSANGGNQGRPSFNAAQLNGHNPFSSPRPHSPTSLPPPSQSRDYAFINGHPPQSNAGSVTQSTTLQTTNGSHSYPQRSDQTTPGPRYDARPSSQNGYQTSIHSGQRRSSMTFPSPLASAPILKPSPTYNRDGAAGSFSIPTEQDVQSTPVRQNFAPDVASSDPSAAASQVPSVTADPSQAAALPPAITGISPTKHSPPHPNNTNGTASFVAATPHALPPVAALSPSPQHQNLSPPVKHSEPEPLRPFSLPPHTSPAPNAAPVPTAAPSSNSPA